MNRYFFKNSMSAVACTEAEFKNYIEFIKDQCKDLDIADGGAESESGVNYEWTILDTNSEVDFHITLSISAISDLPIYVRFEFHETFGVLMPVLDEARIMSDSVKGLLVTDNLSKELVAAMTLLIDSVVLHKLIGKKHTYTISQMSDGSFFSDYFTVPNARYELKILQQ